VKMNDYTFDDFSKMYGVLPDARNETLLENPKVDFELCFVKLVKKIFFYVLAYIGIFLFFVIISSIFE